MNSRTAPYCLERGRVDRRRARPAAFSRSRPDIALGSGGVGRPGHRVLLLARDVQGGPAGDDDLDRRRARAAAPRRSAPRRRPARSCRGPAAGACRASQSASVSSIDRVGLSATPSVRAIRGATSIGSRIGSRGTKKTPSGKSSEARAANWSDSRVLPVPPGPVSVSRRVVVSRRAASASSSSRPMNVVSWVGRLFGRASSERSGGNVACSPSASTWKMRTGAPRSLSRCSPRSRRVRPSTGLSPYRSRVVPDTRIWPPCATAAIRAARLTPRPTRYRRPGRRRRC